MEARHGKGKDKGPTQRARQPRGSRRAKRPPHRLLVAPDEHATALEDRVMKLQGLLSGIVKADDCLVLQLRRDCVRRPRC